jgi:hypothetical protein
MVFLSKCTSSPSTCDGEGPLAKRVVEGPGWHRAIPLRHCFAMPPPQCKSLGRSKSVHLCSFYLDINPDMVHRGVVRAIITAMNGPDRAWRRFVGDFHPMRKRRRLCSSRSGPLVYPACPKALPALPWDEWIRGSLTTKRRRIGTAFDEATPSTAMI